MTVSRSKMAFVGERILHFDELDTVDVPVDGALVYVPDATTGGGPDWAYIDTTRGTNAKLLSLKTYELVWSDSSSSAGTYMPLYGGSVGSATFGAEAFEDLTLCEVHGSDATNSGVLVARIRKNGSNASSASWSSSEHYSALNVDVDYAQGDEIQAYAQHNLSNPYVKAVFRRLYQSW